MKKIILALTLASATAQAVESPCYWSGTYVKCLPSSGIFLDNHKALLLGTDNTTNYVSLVAPGGMSSNIGIVLPATYGTTLQLLGTVDDVGTLGWFDPGITQAAMVSYVGFLGSKRTADLVCHSNVTLSGTQTCDGQFTSGAGVILAMAQTDPTENGLWAVDDFVAWTRVSGYNFASLPGSITGTNEQGSGTTYQDTLWFGHGDGSTTGNFYLVPTTGSNTLLTPSVPVITDANSHLTTETFLNRTRGGTGITSTATFPSSGTVVTEAATENLTNKTLDNTNTVTLKDTKLTVQDDGDVTKQMVFQLSGITAGNTRTLTVPDASTTLVGTDATQTLTNKTLDNTSTVTLKDNKFTLQDDGDVTKQMVFQLSGVTAGNTRTLTVPDASTTLVGTDATQTLTNKTLTSPKLNENVVVTSTATQVNYLAAATGTTGTTSTNLVYSTSPTFITPTLGAATATSVNKMAITAPGSSSTLAVADGKVFTASNTLTLTGTDGSSVALGTGGNVAYNPTTTTGDIIYASNTATPATLARLAIGASTTVLHGGTTPAYSQIVDADVSSSAAIAGSKLAAATSTAAGTIPTYATGSFTASFGSTTGPATDTWYYVLTGKLVTIMPGSNTKSFTMSASDTVGITGVPSALLPTVNVNTSGVVLAYNGGGYAQAAVIATTAGFTMTRDTGQDTFGNGTTSSLEGWTFSYILR